MRKAFQNANNQMNRLHQRIGSSPLILAFLGILVLVFWACGTTVQIQTSEYLAMGANARVAGVAWGVLMQPWLMVSGQAPVLYSTAWEYAWVVEVVTLVFALALAVAIFKISEVNPTLGKWFVICGAGLILLNGYADYSSSPGANWLVQFLIALAIGGIVVVGLPLGVGLIEEAISQY